MMSYISGVFLTIFFALALGIPEEELKIVIHSPNLTFTQKTDVLLCTTVPIPSGDQFIVGIRGKPIPGVHHHLMVILCDEPGYRVLDAGRQENENPVWECGYQNLAERTSLLPNARECSGSGDSFFNYQFQGGSEEEGSLVLPPGTGVQLGSGFNSIIGMFHFFRTDELVNGSTAGAEIEITFRRSSNTSHINQVRSLLLMANGFVGAKSVSSVAGSWTLEEETEMHILQLYTHWHELNGMAIEIQVWVERQDRKRDILLRKDPKSSSGISDVSNSPAAVMRRGDRLVVRCTFNNTESHNLRVEERDMCDVVAYFTTTTNTRLAKAEVISIDPFYKECIQDLSDGVAFPWTSINYEGWSDFHGAGGKDCF